MFTRIMLTTFRYIAIVVLIAVSVQPTAPIHAQSSEITFAVIGDYGMNNAKQRAVSVLVKSWTPDFIVTAGDNSYSTTDIDDNIGQFYSDFIGNYQGKYGSGASENRFFPAIGNHDYTDGAGIDAYFNYFTLPGNERYYDFSMGAVHFFVVNSNVEEPDGILVDSVQALWLEEQLKLSTLPWQVVVLHHSPFSSQNPDSNLEWDFEAWGADAVLTGHSHTYERVMRDDNSDGVFVPYLINGVGGGELYSFAESEAGIEEGSVVRYDTHHGAVLVKASTQRMTFEFWSIANGGELLDVYTVEADQRCVQMFNDLAFADGQLDSNITKFTAPSDNNRYPYEGYLIDYATGNEMPYTLNIDGGEYNEEDHASMGRSDLEGDAASVFAGKADPEGTFSYVTGRDEIVLYTFSDLDPNLEYNVAFYTNRNGQDSYTWERASQVSLTSVEDFVNTSTLTLDIDGNPTYSGFKDHSTAYAANNSDGHIVRYEHIRPGLDGTFALLVEAHLSSVADIEGQARYGNLLMLEACQID